MDPWGILQEVNHVYYADMIYAKIFRLLEIIGILGCVLTSVFYVIQVIFHPSSARGVNAGKEGFKYKLIIAFFICTASLFMGIVFDFVYKLSGYM